MKIPNTLTDPWEHQAKGYEWAMGKLASRGGAMLAMDMGTGKTKLTIDIINNLPDVSRVIVTCPLSVVPTWADEMAKHCSRPYSVLTLAKGSVQKRANLAGTFFDATSHLAVVVINHEAVWREPFRSLLIKSKPGLMVVDECHRAKAPGGKLSRFLDLLSKQVKYRLGLTGTPMPRDILDIYAQFRFIDANVFGRSYMWFSTRYGQWIEIKTGRRDARGQPITARKLVGIRHEDELMEKIDSLAFRVKADDVLDLPPAIVMRRECELGSEERRFYNDLKRDLIAEIEGGFVTASNALTKILRLQQAVQGIVTDEDGTKHELGSSKAALLRDVLEDLDKDEPVVVFCRFHTDLDQVAVVAKDLGRSCLELSGRVNQLEQFKKGGGTIIAVQIQSGGVGVDLSRAAYTIYFSPTYDMGAYEQSLRRTRRPSEHRHGTFFYYHLVATDTIDVDVYHALSQKKAVVEYVLEGIRNV